MTIMYLLLPLSLAFVLAIAITGHTAALSAKDDDDNVRLMVGRSAVVNTGAPIARVSLTSDVIADALVTLPNLLLIQG